MATELTASVGVDVDSLWHYYRIHGLDEAEATNAAWAVGVPRFVELFEELGLPATFYCIAEDIEVEGNAARLKRLAEAGFEIGNHTWHHRYDLTRLDAEDRWAEVARGRQLLEEAAGAPVVGFRSPGYTTSGPLSADVRASGHTYDSSVFPCVPYYTAKGLILGGMALRGRQSSSIMGPPSVLAAPRSPYPMSPENPHVRGTGGLPQFPVSVMAGVPLIGTAMTALGRTMAPLAVAAVKAQGHITLEFHAADLLSMPDDDLDPALAVQRDLRVSVDRKRRAFRAILESVARVARFERLDRLAPQVSWVA